MPAGQIQPDACVCKKALLEYCHNYSFNASRMAAFPVRQQTSVIATDTTWTSKHKKVSIQPFAKKEKYACQHLFQGKSHWRIWRQGLAIPDKQRQQSNKEKKKKDSLRKLTFSGQSIQQAWGIGRNMTTEITMEITKHFMLRWLKNMYVLIMTIIS